MGFLDKSFLDKAKAAATDLAAKADTALSSAGLGVPGAPSAGEADKYFRDLGVLTYLQVTGREASAAERDRVLGALGEIEARGALHSLTLHTAPPPAPGAVGPAPSYGAPPAPGYAAPPAPGAAGPAPSYGAPPAPGYAAPPAPGAAPSSAEPIIPPAPIAAPPLPERPASPPPPSWAPGGQG